MVACGSVINTPQASIFGPPNPLIGVSAFCVVITIGVLAVAKVPLPRWFWTGLMIGSALAVVVVHWPKFETLYEIGALCPYCMVVWAVMICCSGTASISQTWSQSGGPVLLQLALADRGAVVRLGDPGDPGPVLGLLVHPDLA